MLTLPVEVPAVAEADPHRSDELEVAAVVEPVESSVEVEAVVAVLPSEDEVDELDAPVAGVDAGVAVVDDWFAVVVAAKHPVRTRNVPALATAALRRARLAGCGRRRRCDDGYCSCRFRFRRRRCLRCGDRSGLGGGGSVRRSRRRGLAEPARGHQGENQGKQAGVGSHGTQVKWAGLFPRR